MKSAPLLAEMAREMDQEQPPPSATALAVRVALARPRGALAQLSSWMVVAAVQTNQRALQMADESLAAARLPVGASVAATLAYVQLASLQQTQDPTVLVTPVRAEARELVVATLRATAGALLQGVVPPVPRAPLHMAMGPPDAEVLMSAALIKSAPLSKGARLRGVMSDVSKAESGETMLVQS